MPIARETRREARLLDEFAEAMGHELRRQILFKLHCGESPLRFRDFFDRDRNPEALRIKLRHTHLPKLDSMGLINWDRDRSTIRRGGRFEHIDPLLEILKTYYDYVVPISDNGQKA